MADRTSPAAAYATRFADLTGNIRLRELPFQTHHNIRTDEPLSPPGRYTRTDTRTIVWLGPDEYLLIGTPDEDTLVKATSAVDVSAHRTTLLMEGPAARDVLSHGCALDLHPRVFAPGRSAQTTLAHTQVILLAEPDGYQILVRSSFAAHLCAWLLDASSEYRL